MFALAQVMLAQITSIHLQLHSPIVDTCTDFGSSRMFLSRSATSLSSNESSSTDGFSHFRPANCGK